MIHVAERVLFISIPDVILSLLGYSVTPMLFYLEVAYSVDRSVILARGVRQLDANLNPAPGHALHLADVPNGPELANV